MPEKYQNPVYPRPFPDPFVLKHQGAFWAYGTGFWKDGRCFGILYSPDLVHWQEMEGALAPLPEGHTCYWAPEVSYFNGQFYLYYSVGDGTQMEVRVAVSGVPQGPFEDSGQRLTREEFAIDPHVFQDLDGSRYLFYAADFLEVPRIGTGTVVDRLVDPLHLAGEPRPVSLARFDWQIFDPQRMEKGGVCWHTVEGPFVLEHKGRYYQMFSGGNWQSISYGVGYAISPRVDFSTEWEQVCDGEKVLPVLRTLPDRGVTGPGHNSVVRGPDNRQLFCVYHRWVEVEPAPGAAGENTQAERVMAIDRLDWIGERLVVLGPSNDPQPVPLAPTLQPFRAGGSVLPDRPEWKLRGGNWTQRDGMLVQEAPYPGKLSDALMDIPSHSFLLEVGLQSWMDTQRSPGAYGILLEALDPDGEMQEVLTCDILPTTLQSGNATAIVSTGFIEQRKETAARLPAGFLARTLHLLRLEVNGLFANLTLDGQFLWKGLLAGAPARLGLCTRGMAAAFDGLELTLGWEDRFDQPRAGLEALGWKVESGDWLLEDKALRQVNPGVTARICKSVESLPYYEMVVNVRIQDTGPGGGVGFLAAGCCPQAECSQELLFHLQPVEGGWALAVQPGDNLFHLPEEFDPQQFQQFRFWKLPGRVKAQWVGAWSVFELGEIAWPDNPSFVGLVTQQAAAEFDLVRVTAIPA